MMTKILPLIILSLITLCTGSQRWVVHDIIFSGNRNISSKELLEVMELAPRRLFRTVEFTFERLGRDIASVEAFYRSRGYRQGVIEDFTIDRDTVDLLVTIVFVIDEGELSRVEEIEFIGNVVFSDDFFRDMISLERGSPLDSSLIVQSAELLLATLRERGFLFAHTAFEIVLPSNAHNRHGVLFFISEGPVATAGELLFTGLDRVRETVVRRELVFSENEVLRTSLIEKSKTLLLGTGLFSFVDISAVERAAPPEDTVEVPLLVVLSERDMFDLQAGGGYNSFTGWYVQLELIYRNIFSLGHRGGISGTWAAFQRGVELSYLYPRVLSSPALIDLRAYGQIRELDGFDGSFYGASSVFIIHTDPFTFSGWLQAERPGFIDEPPPTRSYPPTPLANTFLVGAGIEVDTQSVRFLPGRSSLNRLEIEMAGLIPSGYRFYRLRLDHRNVLPLGQRLFLGWGLQLGLGASWGSGTLSVFPPQHQFRIAQRGIWPVRGYGESDLVPLDENGKVRSGKVSLVVNLFDLRVSLFRFVYGAVFADAGRIWSGFDEVSFGEVLFSAGPGIVVELPFATARLDYGLALFPVSSGTFHFSLGPPW